MYQTRTNKKTRVGYLIPYPDRLKPAGEGEHWTSTGKATKSGYRYCESCTATKPANSRPQVKGWKCDDCFKSTIEQ